MKFRFPLRTVSAMNRREHWAARARRAANEREVAYMETLAQLRRRASAKGRAADAPPTSIRLTRIGPRTLDGDNLAASCKGIRDGIADALGLPDDSDVRVTWRYAQRRGEYGVEVEVRW